MPDISVVIPVYRSAEILPELMARLNNVLTGIAGCYEVIMVCDGSPDHSWKVIRELSKKYAYLRGISLNRNYGQQNALLAGIRNAKYGITVTMDDDLQHPPEEIHKLIKPLEEGYDVVYGTPRQPKHTPVRNLSSLITKCIIKHSMGYEKASTLSAFKALRTSLRDAFSRYQDKFVSIDILLTWGTSRFTNVLVEHDERHSGTSGYGLGKLMLHTINIITSFSALPLQIASITGFICMFFGIVIFGYVIANYFLHGGVVPGFTFIAATIALFSGVQLFSLGIIGEYLSRIHFRSMGQPYVFINERTDSDLTPI